MAGLPPALSGTRIGWLLLLLSLLVPRPALAASLPRIVPLRCPAPLLTPADSPSIGRNINGPSVIRVPDWVPNRLGRYYLYFAHHRGQSIRLAYADQLCGPWTVHEPGALQLDQATGFAHHIASPDVHVDDAQRRILLYFHGRSADRRSGQHSGVALSADGLTFSVAAAPVGPPYLRVFRWGDRWLALAKRGEAGGQLLQATSPLAPFSDGVPLLPDLRHGAVLPWRDQLLVFFSRIGDAPERILLASMDLSAGWQRPQVGVPQELLRPWGAAEGGDLPIVRSRSGATGPARQLRDPAILVENGRVYLFYSLAGEAGIGMAELLLVDGLWTS